MKKITTLFARNFDGDRQVRDEVTPGCEWVLAGEGRATPKYDGTACLVQAGRIYKRYDAKPGRTVPEGAIPCEPEADPVTGHWPHWVLVGDGPEDQAFREGFAWAQPGDDPMRVPEGTYELVGPKVQGNPYRLHMHQLVRHGATGLLGKLDSFEAIRDYLTIHEYEGIVWHHPDGRMCKVKRRDFGLPWPVEGAPL